MDASEARTLDRLREWYEFSERTKIDLAGSTSDFDNRLDYLIVACKIIKIVVNGKTYYRRAKVR